MTRVTGTLRRIEYGIWLRGSRGVKFAFFRGWKMGFCVLGLGFMKQKQ